MTDWVPAGPVSRLGLLPGPSRRSARRAAASMPARAGILCRRPARPGIPAPAQARSRSFRGLNRRSRPGGRPLPHSRVIGGGGGGEEPRGEARCPLVCFARLTRPSSASGSNLSAQLNAESRATAHVAVTRRHVPSRRRGDETRRRSSRRAGR